MEKSDNYRCFIYIFFHLFGMINFKNQKTIILALISIFGLWIGQSFYEKWSKIREEEKRRAQIEEGVRSFFKKCEEIDTFEKRRRCFAQDLLLKRNENKMVQLSYQMEINGKLYSLNSEDLGDLIKISKPKDYSFVRCLSNTYFFDWNENSIFLSLDNPYGSVNCRLRQGGEVFIFPANLSESVRKMIKSTLLSPIK